MQTTIETFLLMACRHNLNGHMALRRFSQNIHLQTIVIAPEAEYDSGFERCYLLGLTRMRNLVGLALTVIMSLAVGYVRAGWLEQMRSLFGANPSAAEAVALF